jgi:TolB-like protein/Tfp pilus assembly protein PilF
VADIFISYSRHDSEQALLLADELRANGMSVWIDQHGIEAATSWSSEIVQALDDAKAVIVLLSASSVISDNVVRELSLAFEAKKTILPVDLEPIALPTQLRYQLAGIQRAALTDRDAIMRSLKKIGLDGKPIEISAASIDAGMRLAVLPFEDLSPAKDQDWFSDGLTYELIDALGVVSELFVVDRQTVREYKNTKLRARQIASDLGVRYIVTGGVQKAGENIRISATLVDSADGKTLWHFKESGTMEDIFEIQEKVAKEITEGLRLTLTPQEAERIEERPTQNAEAYEFYLQSMYYDNRNTMQDRLHAMRLGEEAVALDPNFASALSCLGITYLSFYRDYDRSAKWLDQAENAITRAMELDTDAANNYSARGMLSLYRGETERAIEMSKKAIELAPNNAIRLFNLGFIYLTLGRSRESAEIFEKTIERNPEFLVAHFNLAIMYDSFDERGKAREAAQRGIPHMEKFISRHPDDQVQRTNYATLLFFSGRIDESTAQLDIILASPAVDPNTYFNCACIYLSLVRLDRALELYEKAIDTGFRNIDIFRNLTQNESMIAHPEALARYKLLVERMEKLIEEK